jgi:hypothetical protein
MLSSALLLLGEAFQALPIRVVKADCLEEMSRLREAPAFGEKVDNLQNAHPCLDSVTQTITAGN